MSFLGKWLAAGVVLVLGLWALRLWLQARAAQAQRLDASWDGWLKEQRERNRVMRGRQ